MISICKEMMINSQIISIIIMNSRWKNQKLFSSNETFMLIAPYSSLLSILILLCQVKKRQRIRSRRSEFLSLSCKILMTPKNSRYKKDGQMKWFLFYDLLPDTPARIVITSKIHRSIFFFFLSKEFFEHSIYLIWVIAKAKTNKSSE